MRFQAHRNSSHTHRLTRRSLLRVSALAVSFTLALTACSPQEGPQKPVGSVTPEQSYDLLVKEGRGFVAGSLMSSNTVFVLFDPQCPHCGHLWEQALPLQKKLKFVWMPVAFIGPKSAPQGAALLTAANPVEAMGLHEASLLAGSGGTSASASIPDDIAAAIKKNTELFNSMGVESVPYIVARNATTGQVVTNAGAMETAALQQFLGLN
jgi:thiol:disulfide interchange protein DsbG